MSPFHLFHLSLIGQLWWVLLSFVWALFWLGLLLLLLVDQSLRSSYLPMTSLAQFRDCHSCYDERSIDQKKKGRQHRFLIQGFLISSFKAIASNTWEALLAQRRTTNPRKGAQSRVKHRQREGMEPNKGTVRERKRRVQQTPEERTDRNLGAPSPATVSTISYLRGHGRGDTGKGAQGEDGRAKDPATKGHVAGS